MINLIWDLILVIDKFLDKAIELEPKLIEKNIRPKKIVEVLDDANVRDKADINSMKNIHLKKGDSIVLDFGDHQVGFDSELLNFAESVNVFEINNINGKIELNMIFMTMCYY